MKASIWPSAASGYARPARRRRSPESTAGRSQAWLGSLARPMTVAPVRARAARRRSRRRRRRRHGDDLARSRRDRLDTRIGGDDATNSEPATSHETPAGFAVSWSGDDDELGVARPHLGPPATSSPVGEGAHPLPELPPPLRRGRCPGPGQGGRPAGVREDPRECRSLPGLIPAALTRTSTSRRATAGRRLPDFQDLRDRRIYRISLPSCWSSSRVWTAIRRAPDASRQRTRRGPEDGEGGIRTRDGDFAPYSLSRRVPSATRPPLRAATSLERGCPQCDHQAGPGGVAERLNATVLKTVVRATPAPRVRIPPPPLSREKS